MLRASSPTQPQEGLNSRLACSSGTWERVRARLHATRDERVTAGVSVSRERSARARAGEHWRQRVSGRRGGRRGSGGSWVRV